MGAGEYLQHKLAAIAFSSSFSLGTGALQLSFCQRMAIEPVQNHSRSSSRQNVGPFLEHKSVDNAGGTLLSCQQIHFYLLQTTATAVRNQEKAKRIAAQALFQPQIAGGATSQSLISTTLTCQFQQSKVSHTSFKQGPLGQF